MYLHKPIQNVTQGQLLSGVKLVRIKSFPCKAKELSLSYYLPITGVGK